MRLATIRTPDGTRAARVEGERCIALDLPDVTALLRQPDWRSAARGVRPEQAFDETSFAPVVLNPSKIFCVGLNYRAHILEMGRELPEYPTLFAKFAGTVVGAHDLIERPAEVIQLDWEAELAIVIGRSVRRATYEQAEAAIGGFTVLNDLTMRDWQYRTTQWLQGKAFEGTTPVGPVMVTPDELPGGVRPRLRIRASVDGETMRDACTDDLVFDPVELVRYISTITTLRPGDLLATGTPGGVGHARTPQRFLTGGELLETSIEHVGTLRNRITAGT